MKHLRGICLLWLLSLSSFVSAQHVGIGTNALYWLALTPNASLHLRMSQNSTFNLELAGRPGVNIKGTDLRFINLSPEARFLLRRVGAARPYVGVAAQAAMYTGQWSEQNHRGSLVGLGPTVGFSWVLSEHFNVEVSAGAGIMYIHNSSTPIYPEPLATTERRDIITPAPVKLGVNFIYYIR